eukprot:gene9569-6724_t
MEDDLVYKIIVIGSVSVGKSNITARFCDDTFYAENIPTLGMDFKYTRCMTLEQHPRNVRLQVWDTSGQDTFATLTTAFYRNCQGAVLCFDLTNRQSFTDLEHWFDLVKRYTTTPPPLILVGCKLDLVQRSVEEENDGLLLGSQREVQQSEGDAWARAHGCLCYLETSAKDNTNVSQVFQQLATYVSTAGNPGSGGSRRALSGRALQNNAGSKGRGGCCGGGGGSSGAEASDS